MDPASIPYWSWWIAAAVLVILEVFAPGAVFIWLAAAATVVGLLALAFPGLGWHIEALVFAVLSVVAVGAYRAYLRRRPIETEDTTLNRRGQQYVGRIFTLVDPIEAGVGRIRIGDSTWRVEGDDLPAGKHVKVVGVEGAALKVERAD